MGVYEWNNLLHVLVDRIFTMVLEREDQLRDHLIAEMQLADWIVELAREANFVFDSGRFSRTGYMPFANKLSNQLNRIAETRPQLMDNLRENEAYVEYLEGDLATFNHLNTRSLGGLKTGPEEKKVSLGVITQDDEKAQNEEKMDSNVSFGIEEIYKEFNELSARYNSSRENSVKSES